MKNWAQMKGLGRVGSGVVAGGTAAVVIAALGVTASQAAWTDTEYVEGTIGSIDCTDNTAFSSTAWGKFLAAFVAGEDISPLLDFEGLTVDSGSPTSTASLDSAEYLGDQAWASPIALSALSAIEVSAGVSLFESPDLGVYTQYGQAFQSGQSTGAAGLLTTSGGAVSLGPAGPEAPGVGGIDLSGVLDEVIDESTAIDPDQLTELGLDLGAVASLTSLDACNAVWDGADLTSIEEMEPYLDRDYLISALTMDFGSSLLADIVDTVTGLVADLEGELDLIIDEDGLTGDLLTDVTDLVSGLLADLDEDLGDVAGVDFDTATIDVDFDATPVLDLLDDAYTSDDGTVTVDLGDSTITADIATLVGDINDLPPNSSLLTPAVLSGISAGVGNALTNFVTDYLTPAVNELAFDASVTVELASTVTILAQDVTLLTTIDGTVAQFTGSDPTPPAVDTAVTTDSAILDLLDDALGGTLSTLLGTVADGLTGGVEDALVTVVPDIGSTLLTPLLADGSPVEAPVDALLLEITGTTIPGLLEDLTPVFDLLGDLVQLSVNVQPDQGGDVPFPAPPTNDDEPGQWFESAIRLALLDLGTDPLFSAYLGSSSAGLNELLP